MNIFKAIKEFYNPTIPEPKKYACKKHGQVYAIGFGLGGSVSTFCGRCYNEWLESNFPITEID